MKTKMTQSRGTYSWKSTSPCVTDCRRGEDGVYEILGDHYERKLHMVEQRDRDTNSKAKNEKTMGLIYDLRRSQDTGTT